LERLLVQLSGQMLELLSERVLERQMAQLSEQLLEQQSALSLGRRLVKQAVPNSRQSAQWLRN